MSINLNNDIHSNNNNNNNNNATFNYSIESTAIILSNANDSLCILFSLVTDSSVRNALDSRANILQSAADMHNLSSSFQFEKSQRERIPLSEHANNKYTFTSIFPYLFPLSYTFKIEKSLNKTQIKYLLYQFTWNFAGYQTFQFCLFNQMNQYMNINHISRKILSKN